MAGKTEVKNIQTVEYDIKEKRHTVYFTDGTRAQTKRGHKVNETLLNLDSTTSNSVTVTYDRGFVVGVEAGPEEAENGSETA